MTEEIRALLLARKGFTEKQKENDRILFEEAQRGTEEIYNRIWKELLTQWDNELTTMVNAEIRPYYARQVKEYFELWKEEYEKYNEEHKGYYKQANDIINPLPVEERNNLLMRVKAAYSYNNRNDKEVLFVFVPADNESSDKRMIPIFPNVLVKMFSDDGMDVEYKYSELKVSAKVEDFENIIRREIGEPESQKKY